MAHTGRVFTLAQARHLVATLRPRIDELIRLRADLAELRADLADHGVSALGGLAEAKALEARLYADRGRVAPATRSRSRGSRRCCWTSPASGTAAPVLWCWLEGDSDVRWYHRLESGFAGRRPV